MTVQSSPVQSSPEGLVVEIAHTPDELKLHLRLSAALSASGPAHLRREERGCVVTIRSARIRALLSSPSRLPHTLTADSAAELRVFSWQLDTSSAPRCAQGSPTSKERRYDDVLIGKGAMTTLFNDGNWG